MNKRDYVVKWIGESDPDFYFHFVTDENRPMEVSIEYYDE